MPTYSGLYRKYPVRTKLSKLGECSIFGFTNKPGQWFEIIRHKYTEPWLQIQAVEILPGDKYAKRRLYITTDYTVVIPDDNELHYLRTGTHKHKPII